MNHTDYLEQQRRNEAKLEAAKARLGEKWILHPANKVKRKCAAKPILPSTSPRG